MKEFNLEEFFLFRPRKEYPTSSEIVNLRDFFAERHITNYKIADALGFHNSDISAWFIGKMTIPAKHRVKLESLKNIFIEWEKTHGFTFNSEKHLSAYKQRPAPPTPKIKIIDPPPIKNAPIHKCPYAGDGLVFGIDYDEYDVCDNCCVSVACHKYNKAFERYKK